MITLAELNASERVDFVAAYARKFGFPFIICVRRHGSRQSILDSFEQRVGNDIETEFATALTE